MITALFRFVLILIGTHLIACASSRPEPISLTPQMLDKQQSMFDSFYVGQSVKESLALVGTQGINIFEVSENNNIYQYVDAKSPITHALFGLYFENRKLVALILEQDVTDFYFCRAYITEQGGHWLSQGIKPYSQWISKRNRLGVDFDKRIQHGKKTISGQFHASDAVEALSYAPVIVIALPYLALDQLAGGRQRAGKKKREKQYLYDTAPTIQISYSEDQLISLLGSYDRKDEVGSMSVFTYYEPSYSFGLIDRQLVWKESASMYRPVTTPFNSSTVLGDADCDSLIRLLQ
jgi:hypothetical protein